MKRPDRKRGTRYRLARWLVPIAALAMTVASSLSAIVPVKRLRILTPCAVLIFLALLPSAASAKAMSFWFSEQHTEVFTDTVSCAGGLTGIATLTETSMIHVVQSPGSFKLNGVDDFDYRLDLPDGAYVQSGLNRDRFVFVLTHRSHAVSHTTFQDFRTIFDASGEPIGGLTIHGGMTVVYDDANGNFEPDPGEIASEHDSFRLRCR